MNELYEIQKNRFSEFHSQYNKFLNMLLTKDNLENETLYKILELNSNMNLLINNLIDIEHNFIKDNVDYKDKLKEYNENEEIFKKFLPFIFMYKMTLNK
jgi:HSP90 family molecular chaperone